MVNADAPYIKMVTEQFDRCHGILLQYVDFLSSAVTPATAYAQLIPSLEELVHTYHLEPEVFRFSFPLSLVLYPCVIALFNNMNFVTFRMSFWSTLLGIIILILRLLHFAIIALH